VKAPDAISAAFDPLTTPGEIAANGVLVDLKYPGYIIQGETEHCPHRIYNSLFVGQAKSDELITRSLNLGEKLIVDVPFFGVIFPLLDILGYIILELKDCLIQRIYVRLIRPSFGLKTRIDSDAVNPGISGTVTTK